MIKKQPHKTAYAEVINALKQDALKAAERFQGHETRQRQTPTERGLQTARRLYAWLRRRKEL